MNPVNLNLPSQISIFNLNPQSRSSISNSRLNHQPTSTAKQDRVEKEKAALPLSSVEVRVRGHRRSRSKQVKQSEQHAESQGSSDGYRIGSFDIWRYRSSTRISYCIERVIPSTPWHPRVFYAGTERKLRYLLLSNIEIVNRVRSSFVADT